jgi:tryptophanyl-tRNA synthetase
MMNRVFSGIQPTGDIHIGNYVGALRQWVTLMGKYECIYAVVDYHAITVDYTTSGMADRTIDTALILIACGLDPEKCHLMVQSHVAEHTELGWIFNCVIPVGEVERMTQFKDKSRQHKSNINMGLMDYPVLQAADILVYRAEFVPVGEDQVQHIELSREIARKFNARFGQVFPEPQPILSCAPKIMGTEGKNKMSKTLNNYIGILEDESSVWEKLRTAVTDVARVRRSDPGNPEVCNVYTMHLAFSPEDVTQEIDRGCRSASIGCIDCKRILFKNMMAELAPIRERALSLRANPRYVVDALRRGAAECSRMAKETMNEVRSSLGLLKP